MNILFFHNSIPEYRIAWFKEIRKLSKITFLITNLNLAKKIYDFDGTEAIKDLNCVVLNKGFKKFYQIYKLIKENNYNFIQLPPTDSFNDFIVSLFLLYTAKKYQIKTSYFWEKWNAPIQHQTIKRKIKNFIKDNVAKIIYNNVDVIFSPGIKNKEYFIKNGANINKIKWLPNSTNVPNCEYINLKEKYFIPSDAMIALYFGRIIKEKGLDILIKAYDNLPDMIKDRLYILVAGDGDYSNYCKKLVNNLQLKHIVFCGRIDPSMRYNYFNQSDIFVFPCTYYNGWVDVWGLTVNEAIQCKKVIIATEAVGSAYELVNENNGYIIRANDVNALTNALLMANNTKDIFQKAVKEDKRLYDIYNPENMALVYINALKEV